MRESCFNLLHCFIVELVKIFKARVEEGDSFAVIVWVVHHDIYLGTEARTSMFEEHFSKLKRRGQKMVSVFYTISSNFEVSQGAWVMEN